jgi:hypothetical protein
MAWREKLKVMNSTMGLRPLYAEPDTAHKRGWGEAVGRVEKEGGKGVTTGCVGMA